MVGSSSPGPLVGRTYSLPDGLRIRLRLSRARDAVGIARLLERDPQSLDVARLVRFDPRRRAVICATTLIDAAETVIGVGAIDLDAAQPDALLVADELDGALRELLGEALVCYANAVASRRVA
jgi:hypothetical protein